MNRAERRRLMRQHGWRGAKAGHGVPAEVAREAAERQEAEARKDAAAARLQAIGVKIPHAR